MKKPAEYIYSLRNDYQAQSLGKLTADRNPFRQFEGWLAEAIGRAVDEPNAMVLSTAAKNGAPSARVVLLRGLSRRGFVFYTNYDSRKGQEIAENPRASLLFFWAKLERQVRVEGLISKIGRRQSAAYFASRPRESQIGAWASAQSRVIASRRSLEEEFAELEAQFAGKKIPCPPNWGGYILKPDSFEFWQGGKNRLHDRLLYSKTNSGWKIERLSP